MTGNLIGFHTTIFTNLKFVSKPNRSTKCKLLFRRSAFPRPRTWELCARRLTNSLSFANLTYNQAKLSIGLESAKNHFTYFTQHLAEVCRCLLAIQMCRVAAKWFLGTWPPWHPWWCSRSKVALHLSRYVKACQAAEGRCLDLKSWLDHVWSATTRIHLEQMRFCRRVTLCICLSDRHWQIGMFAVSNGISQKLLNISGSWSCEK